jgi:hypothetical protein
MAEKVEEVQASSHQFEFIRSRNSLRDSERYAFQRKVTPDYFEQVQSRETWNESQRLFPTPLKIDTKLIFQKDDVNPADMSDSLEEDRNKDDPIINLKDVNTE